MTNDTSIAARAVYILDPLEPFALNLHGIGNGGRGATLNATRAFRVGHTSYCADFPHRITPAGHGPSVVECLGLKKGTVSVTWR